MRPCSSRSRGGHRVDRRAIGDVGRDGDRVRPSCPKLGRGRLAELGVDVDDDDARALGGENGGDPASDPARSAGDDGDLIGERLHGPGRRI